MEEENISMFPIIFILLGTSIGLFVWIMRHDPRTLWSGVSLLWMLFCLSVTLFLLFSACADWLAQHDLFMNIMVALLILAMGGVLAFPVALSITLFVEGIKVIRHEGLKPTNLLTILCSVLLYLYLAVWPVTGSLEKGTFGSKLYMSVSLLIVYVLLLMAIYLFSAALNLIHLHKQWGADYIIVLGAAVNGERITPLLAARIDKGIELLEQNPGAVLIMSGGQGPGEDISEAEAMAGYARENGVSAGRIIVEGRSGSTRENLLYSRELMVKESPRVIVVTTSYHVFRALLLAKQQGLKCVGVGSKTKWYFTVNALIREFIGYLSLTWKKHAVAGVLLFVISMIVM